MKHVRFSRVLAGTILGMVVLATIARAENNTSLTINGFGTNIPGAVTIGDTGTNNSLQIINGGALTNANAIIGNTASASNNFVLVSGTGSIWTNTAVGGSETNSIKVGQSGDYNSLTVSAGAAVYADQLYVGRQGGSEFNSVLITGTNSQLSVSSGFVVGSLGANNSLTVSSSGNLKSLQEIDIGGAGGSDNNLILITGAGSSWTNNGGVNDLLKVGASTASNNRLVVSNGANVYLSRATTTISLLLGDSAGSRSNSVTVTGAGTVLTNTGYIHVGNSGSQNQLTISDGATVHALDVYTGRFTGSASNTIFVTGSNALFNVTRFFDLGSSAGGYNRLTVSDGGRMVVGNDFRIGANGAISNTVTVTGSGSLWSNTSTMAVGEVGAGNQLIVTNGGTVFSSGNVGVGRLAGGGGAVTVNGDGSIFRGNATLASGNAGGTGTGAVFVSNSGTLEFNTLTTGPAGTISNVGGIYQFTGTPSLSPSGAGSISLTNGTVSFRGVTSASTTPISGLAYRGNNTYRLNNASNTSVASYTFDSVANTASPSNYQRLTLMNGARWQSTTLRIGTNGELTGSGTIASGSVTNFGTIAPGFSPGQLTLTGNLVLASSSVLQMEIGGTGVTNYDQLVVAGNVAVSGTLSVATINSFSPTPGDTFTLIDNQGANPISGFFIGLTNNAFFENGNAAFRIQYDGGTGNDLVLLAVIPEPNTLMLLIGSGCLLAWKRRRH